MAEVPDDARVIMDDRESGFCYQTRDALAVIREAFAGTRRTTALAVYLTFTDVANEKGGSKARGGFDATRADIAEATGVSLDTLDRYAKEFVKIGVLKVQRHRIGKANLPNTWALCTPTSLSPAATPSRTERVPHARLSLDFEEEKSKEVEANASTVETRTGAPPLHKINGQNLAFNALRDLCGIRPNDRNRTGEVVAALNGGRGVRAGIRELVWGELVETTFGGDEAKAREVVDAVPESFENAMVDVIQRRGEQYRRAMNGATLTPTALAKWWLSLEVMAEAGRGGLTAAEMAAFPDA